LRIRTAHKLLAAGAIAVALASTTLTGPAQANTDPPPHGVRAGTPVVAVSQVTHNYLLPDDARGNAGTYLQVYGNGKPAGWTNTWTFNKVAGTTADPVYQLKSYPVGACATVEQGVDSAVYLRACSEGNKDQWWHLRAVRGTDNTNPDWAIVPDRNETLALTAADHGDAMVYLRQMWGGEPSLAQGWRFYASTDG
jgi:hypothetical protein